MSRLLGILLLMIWGASSDACDCSYGHLDDTEVKASKVAFVFRLVSVPVSRDSKELTNRDPVNGRMVMVENLRGVYFSTRLTYSNHMCCGIRMEVGHFYAVFLKELDEPLRVNLGNLVDLGMDYMPGDDQSDMLRRIMDGSQTFESAFGEFPNRNLHIIPIPPPPAQKPPVRN